MATTKLNAGQVREDTLTDADNDTLVQVEEGSDEDMIRFDTAGTQRMIIADDGNVGIGVNAPAYLLEVGGNVGVEEYIYHNGDADTYIRFEDDSINIYCGGRQMIKMVEAATDKVTINNGGQDVDVQIKGENEANLFRTDAANDLIGIKTSIPKCSLSVSGSMAIEIRHLDNDYDPGTTYTVAATDYLIAVNTRPTEQGGINSAITITLPLAASYPGRLLIIKDIAGYADVNNIIVTRAGSDTIDGLDTSVTLSSPAQCKHYVSNGVSIWMDITG